MAKLIELTGFEKFWYYALNIFSWGALYFMKVAVKKALSETTKDK